MGYFFKELLIIVYIFIGYDAYYARITDLGFSLNLIVYSGLLCVCILGILMACYIRNSGLRILYGFVFSIFTVIYVAYETITASFLTYNSFITLYYSRGFADDAFRQYFSSIAYSVIYGLVLFIGISLKPRYSPPLSNWTFILTPILVLFLLSEILFYRGGDGAKGLLPPYIPLVYTTLMVYEASIGVVAERKAVQIERASEDIDYDIILIIDESIAPRYFDINSKSGVLTNLGNDYQDINIYNYGYAAAINNCSTPSNVSLRYGGTRDTYLTAASSMPSIWAYAKNAELFTVYIDAQRTGKVLQNNMTEDELNYIDEFIQFDEVAIVNRDLAAASKLVEFINDDTRNFILVNKMGGHFPIHDKYPDEYIVYKPILPRGNFLNIGDTGSREGFLGGVGDWLLYRNSYKNTVLWSVGKFFEKIFLETSVRNAVIIYTSDHGQDLHENGNPGLWTHCSSNPKMVEGTVPLVVIQSSAISTLDWEYYLASNKDQSSHYNIFPTLLSLMQYKSDQLKSFYGNSLNTKTNDDMTFNTNYYARVGKQPTWKKIEIKKCDEPKKCDTDLCAAAKCRPQAIPSRNSNGKY